MHKDIDQRPKDQTECHRPLNQVQELSAGEIVCGCCAEGDNKVQNHSQNCCFSAAMIGSLPKHATCNGLRNKNGPLRAIDQDCICKIKHTGNETTYNDRAHSLS